MRSGIEVSYSVEDGLSIAVIIPYQNIDKSILVDFWNELQSMPDVVERLKFRGLTTDDELLREYLICRYGGSDQVIDMLYGKGTSDYCHCGNRGHCPDEGFVGLCSVPTVGDIKLSKSEIENLSFVAKDKSVKEIATIRNRSLHTVETQVRSIRAKLSAHSMATVMAKTTALGITNPYAI